MTTEILITEKMAGEAFDRLSATHRVLLEPDGWRDPLALSALTTCRALIVRNQTRVTAELFVAAPRLEVVARAGAGLDNIDVEAASAAGVVVASTPEQNSVSVAELGLGMMLALARNIPAADRSTRAGEWDRHRFTGCELYGKTLGVVGLGRIGFLTALRARAFGMNIIAADRYVSPDSAAVVETHAELVELDELLQRADFVSCHVPATDETRHLFNLDRFNAMKHTAYFLNLSRGEVVDESGLEQALREGRIAGAALDVREQEPPGASTLAELGNVILTPHIAAFTREGQARVNAAACGDVGRVLGGEPARNFVNFPRPRR